MGTAKDFTQKEIERLEEQLALYRESFDKANDCNNFFVVTDLTKKIKVTQDKVDTLKKLLESLNLVE